MAWGVTQLPLEALHGVGTLGRSSFGQGVKAQRRWSSLMLDPHDAVALSTLPWPVRHRAVEVLRSSAFADRSAQLPSGRALELKRPSTAPGSSHRDTASSGIESDALR